MADYCATDPTAGCDNSQLLNAINACCATTNGNLTAENAILTSIDTKLGTISTKMDTVISLLQTIAANVS